MEGHLTGSDSQKSTIEDETMAEGDGVVLKTVAINKASCSGCYFENTQSCWDHFVGNRSHCFLRKDGQTIIWQEESR